MNRRIALWLGVAIGAAAFLGVREVASLEAAWVAGITGLCATWWVLEPIPIPATSLIPFAAFPLVGVLTASQVAVSYGHNLILLLMGGFILSTAIERNGAHKRMALGMVALTGRGGRRLILGFMIASAVCSMWISNTATTLMLLPIALAVLGDSDPRLEKPLLLGIAYAASIGGLATPVGTPPNVIFMGVYEEYTKDSVSFLEWMTIGLPVAACFVPVAWMYLTRKVGDAEAAPIPSLGPWQPGERRVLAVFLLTALAWVFRTSPGGGWQGLLGITSASDSTVALAGVVVMFIVPDGDGDRLLDWDTARKIPWGLLLLFGGGICIASAFGESGLSAVLGDALTGVAELPTVLTIGLICLSVTFLTEVTSNTATTNLLMPILAATATAAAIDHKLLMIPAALSASCAFMLPVATAPNAIMFGTHRITTREMAREGFALNLIGVAIITALSLVLLG